MEFIIIYSQTQMQEAAKFIWDNNPVVKSWPCCPRSPLDVYNFIRNMAVRDSEKNYKLILEERKTGNSTKDKWINFSGTGGFYIIYDLAVNDKDKIQIDIDVVVDPSVGMSDSTSYVTELIAYMPEIV